MRRQLIVVVSLGLNVLLVLLLVSGKFRPAPAKYPSGLQAAGTNRIRTEVVLRKQFFSWREVESADYPAYIINLRGIGCPEQTVRDIIIADVNQLYTKKQFEEVDTPDEQWWRTQPDTNFVQASKAKSDALEQERRTLLTSLLGTNWDAPYPSSTRPIVALNGPVLGEIEPAKKDAVQEIVSLSQKRVKAYLDAQQAAGKEADPAELARLQKQTRDELAHVLTPPQMDEFLLRYSQSAMNLRSQLAGFEVTPDEFRAMFHARDTIELQIPFITGDTAAVANQRAAFDKQEEDAIKTALGPKRYGEFLLSKDPAYQDAMALAREAGATPEALQRLYELNKAVRQEQDRIRNDASLTPEEKEASLASLQQQQQNVSDQILGLPPPPPPPLPPVSPLPAAIHAYAPGETVDMIAARYGVSANSILNANPNVDFNQLQKGSQIRIPKVQQ